MNKSAKYLLIFITAWLLLIFVLSSQNGPQTAKTSEGIAYRLTKIFCHTTNQAKVNEVHMLIRKVAHVFLFMVLGVLLGFLVRWVGSMMPVGMRLVIGYLFLLFCCFFDEWHKQFIAGRHNQLSDAKLNVIGGTIGFAAVAILYYVKSVRSQ